MFNDLGYVKTKLLISVIFDNISYRLVLVDSGLNEKNGGDEAFYFFR